MEANGASRPAIPADVKRAVRKKCSFGCVICGMPIYHYEHIEDYASVKSHDEENLVLLCPNHHQDKTSGRLSRNAIRKSLDAVVNSRPDTTTGHRFCLSGERAEFRVGGNIYLADLGADLTHFPVITLAETEMLAVDYEQGFLLLNLTFHDDTGRVLLSIERSEMRVSTGAWDFRLEGSTIKVWSQQKELGLDMSISDDIVTIRNGVMISRGARLVIEPEQHTYYSAGNFSTLTFSGVISRNTRQGIRLR